MTLADQNAVSVHVFIIENTYGDLNSPWSLELKLGVCRTDGRTNGLGDIYMTITLLKRSGDKEYTLNACRYFI